MINLLERLFRNKKNEMSVVIKSDIYYLSIHMNRQKQENLDKMNLFIRMLNERNIEFKTFTSEPTLMTLYNKDRFVHFNVCVEMKYKDELEQISKDVYNF